MWEWITIAASLIGLLVYETYLRRLGKHAPMMTARTAHATIRSNWVRAVMSRSGTEVLVIQTLRNSVMAASFMATTAVLALSATLTLSGVGNASNTIWGLARDGSNESILFAIKLLLLAASFFVSFLFLAMAVRFFNHTGYLITGAVGSEEDMRKQTLAIAYLNRAGNYYSFGLRAFFVCVPFLASLFSTYLMLPATVLLILILYWFDRVPYEEQ